MRYYASPVYIKLHFSQLCTSFTACFPLRGPSVPSRQDKTTHIYFTDGGLLHTSSVGLAAQMQDIKHTCQRKCHMGPVRCRCDHCSLKNPCDQHAILPAATQAGWEKRHRWDILINYKDQTSVEASHAAPQPTPNAFGEDIHSNVFFMKNGWPSNTYTDSPSLQVQLGSANIHRFSALGEHDAPATLLWINPIFCHSNWICSPNLIGFSLTCAAPW